MEALILKQILSWCPTAISAALAVAVFYLIKKIDKNDKSHAERTGSLQAHIENKLTSFKMDTIKILDEHARRVSHLEMECIKREDFYRELGGWKDDINRVSGQLTNFINSIIDLWKDKR